MIKTDHSEEAMATLGKAETKARQKDMMEVIRIRMKSRENWLTWGDSPTNYFFYQLKEKQAWESIRALTLGDGTCTEDEDLIMQEIYRFYTKLF